MKTRPLSLPVVLLALACSAFAETFVLKDGTELQGTLLRENEDSYVIEVPFSATIKEERTVPKDQVVRIRRAKPDLVAFKAIEDHTPAPDMLGAGEYSRRIADIEKFLKEHRTSSKYDEAKKMLAELKGEANEILAGGIKLDGRIIPAEEYRANQLEIDARIQETRIRELIDQGNLLTALRLFTSFEADFKGTSPHTGLLPLIQRAIRSHIAQAERMLAAYDARIAEREAGLQRMAVDERRITQNAIAEENEAMEARFNAEKAANIGWVTIDPYFKPALSETISYGRRELDRINSPRAATTTDTGALFRETLRKIRSGADAAEITKALGEARSARMPEKYLTILETAAS